jgi:hypothetical protein
MGVRHEALIDRAEVKDSAAGLSEQLAEVEASRGSGPI